MVEIVVVGAGAIGAAVAARLGAAGASVALIEQGEPGSGTSATTLAWVNAVEEYPRHYFDLRVAAMREHADLERALDADWLRRSGSLEWAEDDPGLEALAAKVDRLQAWGYAAQRVSPAAVVADLEPGLAVDGVPWVAHFPADAWAQPDRLVRALVDAATASGVALHAGRRVTGIAVEGGRVRGVELDGRERLPADVVVCCAGPAAADVVGLAGAALPLRREPGLVLTTTPTAAPLARVVRTPAVAMRPDAGGRILVNPVLAAVTEDAADPASPASQEGLRRARRLLPALADAAVATARVGVRPMPVDGLPLVGPVPGLDGAYLVATHSGITLAPLLGRLVAEELVHGRPEGRLAPFRPDRLMGPVPAT